jgi:hypothetical protein
MPVPADLSEDAVQTIERDIDALEERVALLEVNVKRISHILEALAKGDDN